MTSSGEFFSQIYSFNTGIKTSYLNVFFFSLSQGNAVVLKRLHVIVVLQCKQIFKYKIQSEEVRFGFSQFNSISTFVGYLIPKPSL